MGAKGSGRRPIGEGRMTQADYSRRHRQKIKRLSGPTKRDLEGITYTALRESWRQLSYQAMCALYDAARAEAVSKGFDPDDAEKQLKEAMTK